jgi:hypothetical protein
VKDFYVESWVKRSIRSTYLIFDGRFGIVVGILAYCARGRGFDSRTVQTFVCKNMSVNIGSTCFYIKYNEFTRWKPVLTPLIRKLATRPGVARVQCWYLSVSRLYYACYIHINLSLESLYLWKKPHQNPLGTFKDLSVHRDRQREATLFYIMLW